MSGRLGPRLKQGNESTPSGSSPSLGQSFLQAEEAFKVDKTQNEWKVQKRKQRRSKSKGTETGGVLQSRNTSVQMENERGTKRSNSVSKPFSTKRTTCGNDTKSNSSNLQSSDKNERVDKSHDKVKRNNENFKSRDSGMTYSRLQQISTKDSTDIIRTLANSRCGLEEFLSSDIKPDHMYLIIKILSKLTSSDWEVNKEHVLLKASTPEFFKKIREFVTFLVTDEQNTKRREEMEQFFENLLNFFQAVMDMLPSVAADHLQLPLRATSMALNSVADFQNVTIKSSVLDKMKILMHDFAERKQEKEEREKKMEMDKKIELVYPKPLGKISSVSLYPVPGDIGNVQTSLVPNKIEGPYNNVEHYLNVNFFLLREDFISPLRQGINEYRVGQSSKNAKSKKVNHIRIYKRVTFLKPKAIFDQIGYDICFDPEKRLKVKWESTKRFIFGSLLVFTTDNFETFFLATVVRRDLELVEKKRIVSIVLCDTSGVSKDLLATEFLMAESEVYFEPYYNVLKALQRFNINTFPMKKYIVHVQKETDRPIYTRNGSDVYSISVGHNGINGRKTLKLFVDSSWPSCSELGFDESQRQAFKAALTNDLVIIQGPPGTGKTFIGLKIASALLENSIVWNFDRKSPILVICYTNHALDQFLEGILVHGLTDNLIRIGGRSKSELLEPFNLKERRRSAALFTPNHDQAVLMIDLKKKITDIFEGIKALQDNLENFDKNEGILALRNLKIVMNEKQLNYFKTNDDLVNWLLVGVKLRSQEKPISTDEKGIENLTDNGNCQEFEFDQTDVENVTRLKEVLFDGIDFEERTEPNSFVESVQIYHILNLDDIKKRIDELNRLLDTIPTLEESRNIIQQKMRETKMAQSDLMLIHEHFKELLKNNATIPTQNETNRVYRVENFDVMDINDRWMLYKSWIEFLKSGNWTLLQNLEEKFRKQRECFDEARQYDDLKIVQQADVVGVTTTTAARLQAMLRELRPKIVIVEEAAEVMEAHIVASLSVYCQHLILIGDHKQLRPSAADYRIGKDYHLDVSLFERLINNGISYYTLTTQHRMRPEISRLLVPTIYPTLIDHPSTRSRPRILGMENNVFFMNHNHFEEEVVDIMSKRNVFEARMAMGLARHLLLQGYRPEEITVLTPYNGQMHLLKEEQRRLEISSNLLVTAVDNFQGEENRIIILSLVRSNKDNKTGFLKTENRVCVALSRARDGLYIFGNMDCLTASGTLWQQIQNRLIEQNAFGPALVLRCETHRNRLTGIRSDKDFAQVLEGGCSLPCGETLPCGHQCHSLCHVSKDRHTRYRCSQRCNKRLCKDGHLCTKKCYEKCGNCNILMPRTLNCGHQIVVPCSYEYEKAQCMEPVLLKFASCGHEVEVECHRRETKQCPSPCLWRLDCGHQCTQTCHVENDPDHLKYMCPKPCKRPLPMCTSGHPCPLACFEECEPCSAMVTKTLDCGHKSTVPCTKTGVLCTLPCERTLPCGHPCKRRCCDECGGCRVPVKKTVPLCGHSVKIACSVAPTKDLCEGQCCVKLACGHKCAKRCKDICSRMDCEVPIPFSVSLPCGHSGALIPCNTVNEISSVGINNMEQEEVVRFCSEPCLEVLKCTHRCSGTCGQCMQGRIHAVCDEDCNNTLICGHSCPVPCREICPPCKKPCQARCMHTKCGRKCGEVCAPCSEPCEYSCMHSKCKKLCGDLCDRKPCNFDCLKLLDCNHPCVGFCGEPCPPCKECNPEPYEPFFYTGEEEEPDTKWVLLNDCKHVVDAPNLERWLGMDQEGTEIKFKVCPKCSNTAPNRQITTTQRYMNLVKATFKDIQLVKKKLYGEVQEIRKERLELLNDIEKIPIQRMEEFADNDELYQLHQFLLKSLPVVIKNRKKEIDLGQLRVLRFKVQFFKLMIKMRDEVWNKLNNETRKTLMAKINSLMKTLQKREHKISDLEIESFLLEQNRIVRLGDVLTLQSSSEFQELKAKTQVMQCFKEATNLVNKLTKYTDEHDKRVVEVIAKLKKEIKSNAQLSDADRRMIHQAMSKSFYGGSSAQGHWFKCPNGHLYVITECGGAMQEAKCPEKGCGARIGGQNHRYLPNQQLASEMDGAVRPAWSSGYDMNNFDLNNLH